MSIKKLFLAGFIAVLLVGIPVAVYLVQQQQEVRSRAAPETVLSFLPASSQTSPLNKTVGEEFSLSISMDPGTNIVQATEMYINYDQDKFELGTKKFEPSTTFLPDLTQDTDYNTPGQVVVKLNAASKPAQQVQTTPATIGTLWLKAIAATGSTPSQITFGPQSTAIVGGAVLNGVEPYNVEGGTGNVLNSRPPAFILVANAAGISGTPTPTGSLTPSPSVSITPSPTGGAGATNTSPVCTNLVVDRAATGAAPFSITFTGNGSDSNGTVSKVTFNYGDGPVEDVTVGGGIGTNTVSVQKSHTYNNPGTYTASVILTDNSGAVSSSVVACTQSVTVTTAGSGGTGNVTNPTPTFFAQGPTDLPAGPDFITMAGIGALGVILTVVGAAVFFVF